MYTKMRNIIRKIKDDFRASLDPAATSRWDKDPWMLVLRGRYAEVYFNAEDTLGADFDDAHTVTQNRLRALARERGYRLHTWTTFLFPPEDLHTLAPVLGLRKRRRLSPEQRTKATERLRGIRANAKLAALNGLGSGLKGDARGQGDP